jgi:hypothetical protein
MIFAIEAAPAATPVKPNTAAISAIIKNVIVQRNISFKIWLQDIDLTIACQKELPWILWSNGILPTAMT